MTFPVIKSTAYSLVHTPNLLIHQGTTQTEERNKNANSEYLKELPNKLRKFDEVVAYPPNQAYIGGISPEDLSKLEKPWHQNQMNEASRYAKFGEVMPEDEFYGLMAICDTFELVVLEEGFAAKAKEKLAQHPTISKIDLAKLDKGWDKESLEKVLENGAEPLYMKDELVGCVKRGHETDKNLTSHIILENIAAKASAVLALLQLGKNSDVDLEEVDYIIEASEEACGDMNQRGGGNFAKAIGEIAGCKNATGSDVRGFCAAPAHALLNAAALVKAGVFKNVAVVAGGATAKLGMNGKDHMQKELPILEDVLGSFAVMISENDGVNPVIRTDIVGRHTIGAGSSPQAVIKGIVTDPLDGANMGIDQIDKYSVEMQNPEITVPAGAGDVPTANYKMIAALGVKRGDIERKDIPAFVEKHGMPGFAPTQGHIPSGVPYIGHGVSAILNGEIEKAMIIGKGSLFLARMTNQFDGVSFVIDKNTGAAETEADTGKTKELLAKALREVAEKFEN
ncbi:glycine/sarcosine/betaine reductase complex component C subunit beta [Proteinivorax hydrogeniformans]|uniref:Glycine/sarcosine/betaine reductase complex component C subunit beta n=1 Tax=Proteinivorax hydrogeniformans TaxID=1826727 RepID=A0AAU8HTR5_9FIRM